MAYIVVLNPIILGTVPDKDGNFIGGSPDGPNVVAVAAATALVAGIMTILMGSLARFPIAIAAGLGYMLTRTAFGRIIRAAADNREMAEALGVDMRSVYARVFTLGAALGTLGGALVIPATAAMSEMGIELIVEAFAVVVIGGLGSMRGALVGALVVGVLRAVAISVYPELEMLLIYLIVIAVLLLRPRGLFGGAAA